MAEWTPEDWYAKTLAKQVQQRLAGAPSKPVKVPIDQVEFLHPIDPEFGGGVSLGKQLARQQSFEAFLKANPEFRDLSIDFQNGGSSGVKSAGGGAKGFRTHDGRVILYDSNGRLFAYKRAIAASGIEPTPGKPFLLEVEVIDAKTTPPGTEELILKAQEIRGGKGFDPVTGKVTKQIPKEIPLDDKMVPLNEENAIQAYYRALAELQEAKAANASGAKGSPAPCLKPGAPLQPGLKPGAPPFGVGGGAAKPPPAPRSLTDIQTRDWYHEQLTAIDGRVAEMRAAGKPLEEIAFEAHALRNDAKMAARSFMINQELARSYPPPLTWDEALIKYKGDYEEIIKGSQRSNAEVNEKVEIRRAAGEK
jgi:hypothetical protein